MKTYPQFFLTLLALFVVGVGSTRAAEKEHIGKDDKVAALGPDGSYHVATVVGEGDKRFHVLFEGGDKQWVKPENLFALRAGRKFAVGDKVLAAWKGSKMYSGVITAVNKETCRVKWDDGDERLDVPKNRMVPKGKK